MNRRKTVGLLWGLVAWNATTAVAFASGTQFGPLPAIAGLAVGLAITLDLRADRAPARQSLPLSSPSPEA